MKQRQGSLSSDYLKKSIISMAGYSGTPLAKKLGFKPGARISMERIPHDVEMELQSAISQCLKARKGPFDLVLLFAKTSSELQEKLPWFAEQLNASGSLWAAWPKKASGVDSDLDGDRVRTIGLQNGLVDVKVCAISDIWSGLKFVFRVRDRVGLRR